MNYVRVSAIVALVAVGLSGAHVIAQTAPKSSCAALKQELAAVKDVSGLSAYMQKAGLDRKTAEREAAKARGNIAGVKAQLSEELAGCK